MTGLQQFAVVLVNAILLQDGTTLAALLSLDSAVTSRAAADYLARGGPSVHSLASNLNTAKASGGFGGGSAFGRLPPPWQSGLSVLLEHRLLASAALGGRSWQDAFAHLAEALGAFHGAIRTEGRWVVAALLRLSTDVRVLAKQADVAAAAAERAAAAAVAARSAGGGAADAPPAGDGGAFAPPPLPPRALEAAERTIKKGFTLAISDRGDAGATKKWAALGLVNQLFRCYFSLNQLRLCRNLIRAVEAASFLPFDGFPAPHRVTYKYFTGRLSLYEEHYGDAVASLSYALTRLPAEPPAGAAAAAPGADRYAGHRRAILLYLVPARLLLGVAPSPSLLRRHGLADTYGGIVRGVTVGDYGAYGAALARHEPLFMRRALYLVLDKLRTLVHRSLLRAVQRALDGKTRLRVAWWAAAMAVGAGGEEVDAVEAECVAANLISLGLVKGYIAHRAGFIVLANTTAFPPVAGVMRQRRGGDGHAAP
ncbi:hypothetical protein BU14_0328s0007 [Porphyra umbilicalis]|uniref:PCI domain-containing protein n=1 Tax=Porphyra umbilicalis TaxID=2786 RepID=A0A1X6NYZ0_PORUM|nr:hypothetical protein BU14_0328s0007 [Porphyra umbilicalis]|eukprot:OSX73755.1 hypothetical protein BU14_0328s0007 [Porphyra umbilicalis]